MFRGQLLRLTRSRLKIRLFVRLNEDAMLKMLKFWYTIWTDSALYGQYSWIVLKAIATQN
ncbi:hypothetical protein LEP3755_59530 [Leptolyngbya sp. NIES-3755]|nr:hypothetical protein LEP3755_59530 [Leptolyngbya sp. NIES-3755]